jgi:hypothetical protein
MLLNRVVFSSCLVGSRVPSVSAFGTVARDSFSTRSSLAAQLNVEIFAERSKRSFAGNPAGWFATLGEQEVLAFQSVAVSY